MRLMPKAVSMSARIARLPSGREPLDRGGSVDWPAFPVYAGLLAFSTTPSPTGSTHGTDGGDIGSGHYPGDLSHLCRCGLLAICWLAKLHEVAVMLKFFFGPHSCALASHIALEESGLDYEAVRLDLVASEHK